MLRYSDAEYDVVVAAASRAGMTPTGYAAQAALSVAQDVALSTHGADQEVLLELVACRAQLRRYGNNLNQAARILNAGGEPPEWLLQAIQLADRVANRIDSAASAVVRRGSPSP